jgi:hypothetical protein
MKKFKSKFLTFVAAVCLIVPCMFVLSACGKKDPPHTHAYDKVSYVVENGKAYKVQTCNCEEFTKTEIQDAVIATPQNVNDVIVHLNDKENVTFKEESVNVKTIEAPCFVCDPMNLIRNNLYK